MRPNEPEYAAAFKQMITLVKHTRGASDNGCNGGAFQTHVIDKNGAKYDVDETGQPEALHGHGRIAGPAEYTIDYKKQCYRDGTREHNTREDSTILYHVFTCSHKPEHII